MDDPSIAYRINDTKKYPEKLRNRKGVISGNRYYRVRANIVEEALFATGVPVIGSSWSPSYPLVRLVAVEPRAEQPGGEWWVLTLTYETDDGPGHIPADGLQIVTSMEQVSTTERVYFDLTGTKRIGKDGQGTGKLLTAINFKISTYHSVLPNIEQLLNLSDEPKVNNDAIVLSNVLGSGVPINIPAGQLLYAGFQISKVGDLFRVDHSVHRRRSWTYAQRATTLEGEGSAEVEELDIYESIAFATAFGGG